MTLAPMLQCCVLCIGALGGDEKYKVKLWESGYGLSSLLKCIIVPVLPGSGRVWPGLMSVATAVSRTARP